MTGTPPIDRPRPGGNLEGKGSPSTTHVGLRTVYEDQEFIVINKQADLVCHPTKNGPMSSLIGRLRLYLGSTAAPQLVNRLDRETSGLVLAAKTPGSARELRSIWESRQVQKVYWAIVHGVLDPPSQTLEGRIGADPTSRVAIRSTVRSDGVSASTHIELLSQWSSAGESFSLLEVRPMTGRKHQIRVHLAAAGYPLVGDKIYGADEDCYLALVEGRLTESQRQQLILPYQALHARGVAFQWRGRSWRFECEPEVWFRAFLPPTDAGGQSSLIK